MRFPHLRAALMRDPWAIMPDRLEAICEVVERRCEGIRLSSEEIATIRGERGANGIIRIVAAESRDARNGSGAGKPAGVAVISVMGIIAQHASQVDDISGPGGTSTDRVSKSLQLALAEPTIKSIILNFDSPGGSVHGVQALAEEVYRARLRKPIVAQVNSLAASAAYWIASAANEIIMTPGAQAGSIGVYALHSDASKFTEKEGFKFTFVSAGKYKVEGNPYEPLGDVAALAMKKVVDSYYEDFVTGVARGRGVTPDRVRNGFGEGRVVKDREAVSIGMADRIATLDQTLQRLMGPAAPAKAQNALTSPGYLASSDQDFRRRRHAARKSR